jgi:hypothetical protein
MLKKLIISGLALIGFQVGADGFICSAADKAGETLKLAVFHNTKAPRLAEVMVISDPTVAYGRQTIARFTRGNGTLTNRGASYVAVIDPNVADTARIGENIAGTKLGMLKNVVLEVDFSYEQPVVEGAELEGLLTLNKKNGDIVEVALQCMRYLKGD